MRTLAVTLGLLLAGLARGDESPRQLLERACAAHGGRPTLARAHAERLTLKGTIHVGAASVPFAEDRAVQLPARYRSEVRVTQGSASHSVVHALDGDKAAIWVDGREAPVTATHRAQLLQAMQLSLAMKLAPLLDDPSFAFFGMGRFSLDGRPVVGVRVVGKLQRDLTLYFDEATARLVRSDHLVDGPGGKDVRQEAHYSDYRELGGHPRPCKVVVFRDGKKVMDAEITDARPIDGIHPDDLKRP